MGKKSGKKTRLEEKVEQAKQMREEIGKGMYL